MKIKGVCLHHDAGVLGSAVPREVLEGRLKTLKEIGVNAIRTSHNPQAPDFYELCDQLGLLVLNEAYDEWEFPKRKWLEGWNQGTPGFEGSFDIFADWAEKDLEDFVKFKKVAAYIEQNDLDQEIVEQAEIQVKYSGYIEKEKSHADKLTRLEDVIIPENFNFDKIQSISIEAKQKLNKIRPRTIAQASRISGVSPSDISVLLIYMGR